MKTLDLAALTKALQKNKYVLLVLCLGLLLLLLPRKSAEQQSVAAASAPRASPAAAGDPLRASGIPLSEECDRIARALSAVRGVGASEVLLSADGCVVVCEGADSAEVRLCVTGAVAAYTGLGSDKIYVLKMKS